MPLAMKTSLLKEILTLIDSSANRLSRVTIQLGMKVDHQTAPSQESMTLANHANVTARKLTLKLMKTGAQLIANAMASLKSTSKHALIPMRILKEELMNK